MAKIISLLVVMMTIFFSSAAFSQDIKIGAVLPLSGVLASKGEQVAKGIRLAVSDINQNYPFFNNSLKVIIKDDQCKPSLSVDYAKLLSAEGVVMVVGHYCSAGSIAASKIYRHKKILQMAPFSGDPKLTSMGNKYIIRIYPKWYSIPPGTAQVLSNKFKNKNLTVLTDNNSNITSLYNALRNRSINVSTDSFSNLQNVNTPIIYSILPPYQNNSAEMTKWLHSSQHRRLIYYSTEDITRKPEARNLIESLQNNSSVSPHTIYAYAAVQVWAQAVAHIGSTDPTRVSNAIKSGNFNTVIGRLGFDAKGDLSPVLAGTIKTCGSSCPSDCASGCYKENNNYCCDIASCPRPELQ